MAQLDSIASRVKAPPMTDNVSELRDYLKGLANTLGMLSKQVEYVVNGNIDFNNIRAKGIVADNIDVGELSAISADLGHITAGLIEAVTIIGSLIETDEPGTYPRVELSSTNKLLTAEGDADSSISIRADFSGSPSIVFQDSGQLAQVFMISGILGFVTFGGADMSLNSSGSLGLFADNRVEFNGWSNMYSIGDGQTLQDALNALSARIAALGG